MYLQETDAQFRGTSAILVHDWATWIAVPLVIGAPVPGGAQPLDAALAAGHRAGDGAAGLGGAPPSQVGERPTRVIRRGRGRFVRGSAGSRS